MNAPAVNPNVPLGIKIFTDLVVGGIIRNSDPKVEAQRATTVIAVATKLQAATNASDPTAVMNAIDAAIAAAVADKANDPAVAALAATVIGWVATKASALQGLLAGSATAALIETEISQAATEAINVAQKYLPATAAK